MGDKDVDGILEEFESVMNRIVVTRNSSHRAAPVDELFESATQIFGSERVSKSETLQKAIVEAVEQAKLESAVNEFNTAVVIAGSVVSAGEARAIIRKMKESRR
jgi:dihydrofolate synthase/folylpolyglutamate synthase